MPTPSAYKSQSPQPWTRIELLLALYDRAVENLDNCLGSLAKNDTASYVLQRTRAAAIVTAIRSGVLTEYGEIPNKVDQLCEYVQMCLAEGTGERISSARKVMNSLREGFKGICDEANRLERAGEIPSLPHVSTTFEATV